MYLGLGQVPPVVGAGWMLMFISVSIRPVLLFGSNARVMGIVRTSLMSPAASCLL